MLITCPSCASEYVIDPAHLRPNGRTVRCASCRTAFFVAAEPDTLEDDIVFAGPPLAQDDADVDFGEPTTTSRGDADDDLAFAPAPDDARDDSPLADGPTDVERDLVVDAQTRRRHSVADPDEACAASAGLLSRLGASMRLAATPMLALAVASLLAYTTLARESVVRAAPQMAAVYRLVGLEVNLRGLALESVVSTRFDADGARVLEVEGVVSNVDGAPRTVPDLAFSLWDATETSLYSWTVAPPRGELAAGESAPFRARLVAPPPEARQVLVRFAPASRATLARSGH